LIYLIYKINNDNNNNSNKTFYYIEVNSVKFPMDSGIAPLKLFFDKVLFFFFFFFFFFFSIILYYRLYILHNIILLFYSVFNLVKFPIEVGMDPLNLLSPKFLYIYFSIYNKYHILYYNVLNK